MTQFLVFLTTFDLLSCTYVSYCICHIAFSDAVCGHLALPAPLSLLPQFVFVFVYVDLYLCMCMWTRICICVCGLVFVFVYVDLYLYLCMWTPIAIWPCQLRYQYRPPLLLPPSPICGTFHLTLTMKRPWYFLTKQQNISGRPWSPRSVSSYFPAQKLKQFGWYQSPIELVDFNESKQVGVNCFVCLSLGKKALKVGNKTSQEENAIRPICKPITLVACIWRMHRATHRHPGHNPHSVYGKGGLKTPSRWEAAAGEL